MTIQRTDTMSSAVLLIEPDPLMLTAMGSVLNSGGHKVALARNESSAMESISHGGFDAIVLSIEEIDAGCQFASRLRNQANTVDTPIIFLVPALSADGAQHLAAHGGVFSLLKPIEPDSLIDLVDKALWLPHVAQSHTAQTPPSQNQTSHEQTLSGPTPHSPRPNTVRDWTRL